MTLFLLAFVAPARAQDTGLDAHGFHAYALDGDLEDGLQIVRPAGVWQNRFHIGGVFEYASDPLMKVTSAPDGTITESAVLSNVLALNLTGGWAPFDILRLDVTAPLYLSSTGLDAAGAATPQGVGIGDIRLGMLIAPLQPGEDRAFGVGVQPYLDLPTGNTEEFLGQAGLSGGVMGAATAQLAALTLTGNVGVGFQPQLEGLDNLDGSDQLLLGAGAGYAFTERFGTTLELSAATPFSANEVPGTAFPAEALLSGRYRAAGGGYFLGGVGMAVSGGVGASPFRAFLGGGFGTPPKSEPVIIDTDGDGLLDNVDACVTEPETKNALKDDDGCPDQLPSMRIRVTRNDKPVPGAEVTIASEGKEDKDTTGDGPVARAALPGTAFKARATHGACWAGESEATLGEADGVMEIVLKRREAKVQIEVVDEKGELLKDAEVRWERDGSGCLPTEDSKLPTGAVEVESGIGKHNMFVSAPGYATVTQSVELTQGEVEKVRVVLASTKVKVEARQIAILQVVLFEVDSDVIKPESFALLNEVASVIRANPDAGRVEVAGHTDSDGDDAHNLELSQKRAESVRTYLIDKGGVAAERLLAKGYGETKPLAPNNSAARKAKNRRVEFNMIDAPAAPLEAAPTSVGGSKKPTPTSVGGSKEPSSTSVGGSKAPTKPDEKKADEKKADEKKADEKKADEKK